MKVKGQMSFLIKALFIVIASVLFVLVQVYFTSFQKTTIQEKGESNFKMEATNILQKLVNDGNCLAYVHNETPQKAVIDINKLRSFVSVYGDTEPGCAKALGFDYNVRIIQFEKNFTLYPGKTCRRVEVLSDFLCGAPDCYIGNKFIYVACNYIPKECEAVCEACGEFDVERYKCDPSWGCGDDPLRNCPYTGSCDVRTCPYGRPPSGICCIFKLCPTDACEQVISTSVSWHPACYLPYGKCDLTKCGPVNVPCYWHAHCAKGFIEICEPTTELIGISIPMETHGFGVGFGTSGFSPEKARVAELQLSLPVAIRHNATFSADGIIYIYAVKGELESLSSLIEDVCEKAVNGTPVEFSKEFHFSFPVNYSDGKLCMLDSCKIVECAYPINFENIDREGDYVITFSYNPTTGEIIVRK